VAETQSEAIHRVAESIAEAFIDNYHQRPGSFAELKASWEAQGKGSLDEATDPYTNCMRGALAVMGALEIYSGGKGEALAHVRQD
jgi:hypothetical protein